MVGVKLDPGTSHVPQPLNPGRIAGLALPPLGLMSVGMVIAYIAAGRSLGFFFAGFFLLTLFLPPLVLTRHSVMDRLIIGGSLTDAAGGVWLVVLIVAWLGDGGALARTGLLQWLGLYVVLVCYGMTLAGAVMLLVRLRVAEILAAAMVTVLGLAWLTWPVWFSPVMSSDLGAAVTGWLIPIHPLMASNTLLRHLGVWSEQPVAYHLTNLGQHLPYALPRGPWWSITTHLVLGGILIALAQPISRRAAGGPDELSQMRL